MFYPVDTLKRGGKFYLCWVADSWPLRFATITHRQLWSQDIRKICDDLLEVITNESGRPTNRFSLRLSSQLLRGLVRLYQRKASVLLGDLCMINATVIKHSNKKWIQQEDTPNVHRPRLAVVTLEQPEEEPRVEELIQSSNNVVANIDDITLKEPTIPEIQFLINDGFGELRSEVRSPDRTVEQMLQGSSVAQLSALETADVSGDKSHDKSRPHTTRELQMERISEYDVSMYRKSIGAEISAIGDIEKEIPEIPEIPPPALNVPEPLVPEIEVTVVLQPETTVQSEATKRKADDEIVLEELEARSPKRRRARRLIIDHHTRLGPDYMRDRIANNKMELRCKSASEDVINIRIPAATYLLRPAHDGHKLRPNFAPELRTLYLRNLEFVSKTTAQNRELEVAVAMPAQEDTRSHLQPVEGEPSGIAAVSQIELPVQTEVEGAEVNVTGQGEGLLDISELPTQVVETLSQVRKRTSEFEDETAKRRRSSGFVSYRQHGEQLLHADIAADIEKENIPENIQTPRESQMSVTELLRKAGLADIEVGKVDIETGRVDVDAGKVNVELGRIDVEAGRTVEPLSEVNVRRSTRKTGSEDTETPLGSLDRTKVSLGDTDTTTDSKKFIREQWGTEGTMVKVLRVLREGREGREGVALDVARLVTSGPVIHMHRNIIMARCFTSLLKLKQHGFVKLKKDPDTLCIIDITLGPKFEEVDAE
ncbi:PREDICTED: uncharacterized protein LOC106123627 [Papilio xuthus]|uniref:Uncharacterized protein LOC106123627 n=1 Tax=Papilio xuthus TaxID=66420 RepID=A0AAJ7EFM1_PAPXU|nr:PREDICTED: uncharacterized protein LOC106123627 [Papilio xuthus]